jgi:hypothetical protein
VSRTHGYQPVATAARLMEAGRGRAGAWVAVNARARASGRSCNCGWQQLSRRKPLAFSMPSIFASIIRHHLATRC